MFAVGLVVVIIGALAATFYFTLGGSGKAKMSPEEMRTWFKCSKCSEEFFLEQKDLTMERQRELEDLGSGMKPYGIDCIKCSARKKAILMLKCPNPDCEKYYVPASFSNPLKQQQKPEKYKDICPYCKMELADASKKKGDSLK